MLEKGEERHGWDADDLRTLWNEVLFMDPPPVVILSKIKTAALHWNGKDKFCHDLDDGSTRIEIVRLFLEDERQT